MKRLKDVATLFGLLTSHNTLDTAATKNNVAGTIESIVSSKSSVKSKVRAVETGPNDRSELFTRFILPMNNGIGTMLDLEVGFSA